MALDWEAVGAVYPIVKDILKRLRTKKLSSQDMNVLLLLQMNNEMSGMRTELAGLRKDFKPLVKAAADALRSRYKV